MKKKKKKKHHPPRKNPPSWQKKKKKGVQDSNSNKNIWSNQFVKADARESGERAQTFREEPLLVENSDGVHREQPSEKQRSKAQHCVFPWIMCQKGVWISFVCVSFEERLPKNPLAQRKQKRSGRKKKKKSASFFCT
jgi:hypothetical protein